MCILVQEKPHNNKYSSLVPRLFQEFSVLQATESWVGPGHKVSNSHDTNRLSLSCNQD